MTFKESYRVEKIYYNNIYNLLVSLKKLQENGSISETEKVKELLDNAITQNESILIIFKNIGELYEEDSVHFEELKKEIDKTNNELANWKNEINEKIDDLNNYIMTLIRELDARLEAVEQDLATMQRVKLYHVLQDLDENVNYVYYKGERVTYSEIIDNFNVHLLVFLYHGEYFYLDSGEVHGTESAIEARSLAYVNTGSVGYNILSIFKHTDTDYAIAEFSEDFMHFGALYELTMTSLSGGLTNDTKEHIAETYLTGKNVLLHGNLQGIDVYLTVTGVYANEIATDNYIYNIKAFGYDPANYYIYMVDMPFTGGDYDFDLYSFPVINAVGLGLNINGSQLIINRTYFKEQFTVVFSALSSSATMTRKETSETLTFDSLAAAVASGRYNITAEASENWAGQQGNPITYYFTLETFKNNDGFSNNGLYFKGWKGSSTSHEFEVLDVGITYDTTIYELAP